MRIKKTNKIGKYSTLEMCGNLEVREKDKKEDGSRKGED